MQALAPFAAALVVECYGIDAMVAGLAAIAATNAALMFVLWRWAAADPL